MPSVTSLIKAHTRGDKGSLEALGVALASTLHDTPEPATDPAVVYAEVETSGSEEPGTWQEVRAARDFGDLTEAEYDYLVAAVEALEQGDGNG